MLLHNPRRPRGPYPTTASRRSTVTAPKPYCGRECPSLTQDSFHLLLPTAEVVEPADLIDVAATAPNRRPSMNGGTYDCAF